MRTVDPFPLASSSSWSREPPRGRVRRRYGVFSRSMYDPFYHPYFIDYGGDKQEYFIRMYNVGSGRARRR